MTTQVPLSRIPPAGWAAIAVVSVFAVVMIVIAVLDLYSRPVEQVTGGRKWVWLLVILFINSGLGAIIYLIAGRKPAPADDERPAVPASDRAAAAESLYGTPEDGERL